MIKWLIKILFGSTCKHQWEEVAKTDYPNCDVYLYKCNSCGKFKKIAV